LIEEIKSWRLRFALGLPPSTGMREALQWLTLARLGVLYVLLSVLVLQQVFRRESYSEFQFTLAYGLLALSFAFNLSYSIFLERLPTQWWVAGSHIFFDSLLTSIWLLLSGAKDSLFALLYLIQILLVSLILYQKGALVASIISCLCFGLVTVLNPNPYPNAMLGWAIYSTIFLTLGIVGGYLSEELLRTTQSLKEKQQRIEKLMALHERIISDMPTGLLTVNEALRVNFINPAGEHILGRTSSAMVGKSLAEVEPGLLPFFTQIETEEVVEEPDLSATGPEHHRSFFVQSRSEKGKARLQQCVEIGEGLSKRILRGDVAELEVGAGLGKLLGSEGSGARVLLFQDVTKLLHLEEKLKQHEKLAAVGQLAAGIAHEIRNPLASMSASIEMLKGSLPSDRAYFENQKLMEIAIREIDRLNRLVSEFLDFVKPEKFRFEKVSIEKVLSEVVLSAQKLKEVGQQIRIRESYEPNVFAHGNAEKLKQVIWNLLVNAIQAMGGKKGTVEVGCARAREHRVRFWVYDEGQGMDEEVIAHLYEPFFTTKEKGTGLGLATAYKIVEAHQGEIKVSSQVNLGTKFDVFLQEPAA